MIYCGLFSINYDLEELKLVYCDFQTDLQAGLLKVTGWRHEVPTISLRFMPKPWGQQSEEQTRPIVRSRSKAELSKWNSNLEKSYEIWIQFLDPFI